MATLTPEQRIKWLILIQEDVVDLGKDPTAEMIESTYDERSNRLQDACYEVRCCGENTGIADRYGSRHYECDEVAAQCPDGKWVGWTYWHGGGKHGEPEAIDWMNDAYEVSVTEEEKLVTVRSFAKMEQTDGK